MDNLEYQPREYWNKVASRIRKRAEKNVIAGDDEPYYRYKRGKFLKLFNQINFSGKRILEIGPGPGGNLAEIMKHNPLELCGLDISEEMVGLARKNLAGLGVSIEVLTDQHIHFPDFYFDLSFTSTVLQHTTDDNMLINLISEMCRVTRDDIYIFERIEKKRKGGSLNVGRPIVEYEQAFSRFQFKLEKVKFLDLQVSYLTSGAIRKLFNSKKREEGEQISRVSNFLQKITLPVTTLLDNIFRARRDLTMMHFVRVK